MGRCKVGGTDFEDLEVRASHVCGGIGGCDLGTGYGRLWSDDGEDW
jgi:hypothetical protein